jgi:hypothetical protein
MTRRNILPKTEEMEIRIKSCQSPSRLFNVASKASLHPLAKKRVTSSSRSNSDDDDAETQPSHLEFVKFQKKGGAFISKLNINIYSDRAMPFARLRLDHWYSNDEIFKILTQCTCLLSSTNEALCEWLSGEVIQHPLNGSVFLFDRRRIKNFKKDAFVWKRRKTGGANSIREDRMSLKANGSDCIYACYTHSALMSTFHRRCYWLRDRPDIVLVHYLQTPNSETGECAFNFNSNPIMGNGDEQQKPANEDDLKKEIKSMLWPFYLDRNINNENVEKFIDLIASKFMPVKSVDIYDKPNKQQHVRVNLMAYANLNTENILLKFKLDDENKLNTIDIDDNVKPSGDYNGEQLNNNNNNNSCGSLDVNNNLVQNESDKKIKPKLAIKRNFKSSKSLDGDNNKQNHSENMNSHVQLSITCCSSTVRLLLFK